MTQKPATKARMIRTFLAVALFGSACNVLFTDAFQGVARTTFAPFETETETSTRTRRSSPGQTKQRPFYTTPTSNGNPLEYLQDDPQEWRGPDDPHHILLMGKTFEQPRITVPYVSGSLSYVLGMPSGDADEHASFAKEEGVSILGTWPRKECLDLGVKLQMRDLVCRVVPGTACGAQGWQAKDVAASNDIWDVPSLSD